MWEHGFYFLFFFLILSDSSLLPDVRFIVHYCRWGIPHSIPHLQTLYIFLPAVICIWLVKDVSKFLFPSYIFIMIRSYIRSPPPFFKVLPDFCITQNCVCMLEWERLRMSLVMTSSWIHNGIVYFAAFKLTWPALQSFALLILDLFSFPIVSFLSFFSLQFHVMYEIWFHGSSNSILVWGILLFCFFSVCRQSLVFCY